LLKLLIPAIVDCLEHPHAHVRQNAVQAIDSIYRDFDDLIPDGPKLILNFLRREEDTSCKRNAFKMLIHADQDRALSYLTSCSDQVLQIGFKLEWKTDRTLLDCRFTPLMTGFSW
jgi:coatomer subunit beta